MMITESKRARDSKTEREGDRRLERQITGNTSGGVV